LVGHFRLNLKGSTFMKRSLIPALILAAAATLIAPTLASAKHYRHYRYVPAAANHPPGYSIAPYGNGPGGYDTPYGRYPDWTWDPDPQMRAMLRSEFNRGVEIPGNR
jgi:hypothetical protein